MPASAGLLRTGPEWPARLLRSLSLLCRLQLVDAEHLHRRLLIEGFRGALAQLVHEVALEALLRPVHPFALRRPVHVARRDLRLRHEDDALIAEIGEADRVPGADLVGLAAAHEIADVMRSGGDHRLDHEAGLRHPHRHRGRADRRDRDADADAEDIAVFRVALILVDNHEAARVHQPLEPDQRRDAAEGGQHHRIAEGHLLHRLHRTVVGDLLDGHLAVLDLLHLARGHPLDVLVAQVRFHQPLGVAHPVEAEMADIGLRGDEGHRHLIADLRLAQRGVEDEAEFVGRSIAACALHRADDDRAGLFAEALEGGAGLLGMVNMADRLGETLGAEPLDLVEGQFGAGGDDDVVVGDRTAVDQLDAVLLGVQAGRGDGDEVDVLARHRRRQVDRDVLAVAPADGDPGVRGHEMVLRVLGDDRDLVFLADIVAQLVGHDGAAKPGSENHDMCHSSSLSP
ncbi:hypothetical protein SDC9_26015 [bioreactor metagenome]|uniref:NAD-specific glutamate dehydrogenase n=1 Tax=bioreactor metagenome TaxID=1076179 RepID=A0A644UMX4_9ZZZZ